MEAKKQPFEEKDTRRLTRREWNLEEGKVSREEHILLINSQKKEREEFSRILSEIINNLKKVNPAFGKPYYKINLDISQLHSKKRRYGN